MFMSCNSTGSLDPALGLKESKAAVQLSKVMKSTGNDKCKIQVLFFSTYLNDNLMVSSHSPLI